MRAGAFSAADLPTSNPPALRAALRYLQSLGLIERDIGDTFRATLVGEYVLDRAGAFHLLRSYRNYFDGFAELLSKPGGGALVRRLENVGATGQLHARRYFPIALQWMAGRDVRCVVDVGCGDGEFVAAALAAHPNASAIGVDLSPDAVAATEERLCANAESHRFRGVIADASAVADWAGCIPERGVGSIVSIWFVLHEFLQGEAGPAIRFFRELHAHAPRAEVIVGEIVALPEAGLAAVREESIYPEMLLFHALSGQGVPPWERHLEWLAHVPYTVAAERRFDEVPTAGGSIPSSAVWHLIPQ
jgi:SAM-dependent methyltransferase